MYFNPRSHEGSDIRHCGHLLEYPHFNPRSHEGSDSLLNFSIVSAKGISIHAPTRGATIFSGAACADREYFNPRSHEGSDIALFCMAVTIAYFNPRSHEGSDDCGSRSRCRFYHFNPRSHEGSDHCYRRTDLLYYRFQSTLPRGERRNAVMTCLFVMNFNPRSHEGSDSNFRQKVLFSLSKNCLKYLILTTNYFN